MRISSSLLKPLALIALVFSAESRAQSVMAPDYSAPIYEFDCKLRDRQSNDIQIIFRISGGQMIEKDGKFAGYTPRKVEVVKDTLAITTRFPDQYITKNFEDEFAVSFGRQEASSFFGGISLKVHGIARRKDVRVATLDDGWDGKLAAAGLCDVLETTQHAIGRGSPEL